jgi:hypothetical protein
MKPLSKLHVEAIEKAKTDQARIKAVALATIETPLDMIKAVLLKHEEAVIEVMRDLHKRETELVAEIESLKSVMRWAATEMRYAGWDTRVSDNPGRTDVYEIIEEAVRK